MDFQEYFESNPSSVNEMLKTLERKLLIEREKGKARSIRLLIDKSELPELV